MKDYSKLRPFDLEAARDRGELLTSFNDISQGNPVWRYTAGPDSEGKIIATVLDNGHFTYPSRTSAFRMAPLAWVRKSADEDVLWPVYKGDVLWYGSNALNPGARFDPIERCEDEERIYGKGIFLSGDVFQGNEFISKLTFTPPKVKREGWGVINKDSLVATKEEAEHFRNSLLESKDQFVVVMAEWEE